MKRLYESLATKGAARVVALQLALFTVLVGSGIFSPGAASAGHTVQSGDCWKAGTPLLCRNTWSGAGNLVLLRVINQLNSTVLWTHAQTAFANWDVPQGAQSFRDYARTNDTWVYMNRDDTIVDPNGYTKNCGYISGVLTCNSNIAMNITWSEVYVPYDNSLYSDQTQIAIFAHEFGHTLGLDHHQSSDSLMQSGSLRQGPNVSVDIASDAGCTNGSSGLGVSCIYATN